MFGLAKLLMSSTMLYTKLRLRKPHRHGLFPEGVVYVIFCMNGNIYQQLGNHQKLQKFEKDIRIPNIGWYHCMKDQQVGVYIGSLFRISIKKIVCSIWISGKWKVPIPFTQIILYRGSFSCSPIITEHHISHYFNDSNPISVE